VSPYFYSFNGFSGRRIVDPIFDDGIGIVEIFEIIGLALVLDSQTNKGRFSI
jgi:hypothetical protein